jgi:hypothetical protein
MKLKLLFVQIFSILSVFAGQNENLNFDLDTRRIYPNNIAVIPFGHTNSTFTNIAKIYGRFNGKVNLFDFTTNNTGTIDVSSYIHQAGDFLHSKGGGIIEIPQGIWAANVINTNWVGVTIEGVGASKRNLAGDTYTTTLKPYNTNLPVLTIGNDSVRVRHAVLRNLNLYGATENGASSSNVYADVGIRIKTAQVFEMDNVSMFNFKTNILVKSGGTNVDHNYIIRLNRLWASPANIAGAVNIALFQGTNNVPYVGDVYVMNSWLESSGNTNGSYTAWLDGVPLKSQNTYWDVYNCPFFMDNSVNGVAPYLYGDGFLDNVGNDSSPIIVLGTNATTYPIWSTYVRGNFSVTGTLKQNSTGVTINSEAQAYQPSLSVFEQFVDGSIFFDDYSLRTNSASTYSVNRNVYLNRSGNTLVLANSVGAFTANTVGINLNPTTGSLNMAGGTLGFVLDASAAGNAKITGGHLFLDNNKGVYFKNSIGTYELAFAVDSSDDLNIASFNRSNADIIFTVTHASGAYKVFVNGTAFQLNSDASFTASTTNGTLGNSSFKWGTGYINNINAQVVLIGATNVVGELASKGDAFLANNQTFTGNNTFSGAILQPIDTISATTIDWSTGNTFYKSISGDTTFTFSNATAGQWITVKITAAAANVVTWPTTTWQGASTPTQTSSKTDFYTFFYDGTTYYGSASQNY